MFPTAPQAPCAPSKATGPRECTRLRAASTSSTTCTLSCNRSARVPVPDNKLQRVSTASVRLLYPLPTHHRPVHCAHHLRPRAIRPYSILDLPRRRPPRPARVHPAALQQHPVPPRFQLHAAVSREPPKQPTHTSTVPIPSWPTVCPNPRPPRSETPLTAMALNPHKNNKVDISVSSAPATNRT